MVCKAEAPQPFSENVWKKFREGPEVGVRFPMIQDLIKRHHLKKLNRNEVQSLLGEPMSWEGTPNNEDWYVVKELFHNPSDILETSYFSICLVIKYAAHGGSVVEVGLSQFDKSPSPRKPKETYTKL
jgi:hypothetical protein